MHICAKEATSIVEGCKDGDIGIVVEERSAEGHLCKARKRRR